MKHRWQIGITLLWLLALSILATIYLAWLLYPFAIDHFDLDRWSGLSKSVISANFNHLMTYLLSPFHTQLAMPDFPSSASGLKHFADVKVLFQLTQTLVLLLTVPSFLFLKTTYQQQLLWKTQKVWLGTLISPLVIALFGVLIGFERFFVLFHTVLFPGDSSWLFHPDRDPIILVLPAPFFLACFVLFFILYEGLLIILWFLSKKQWRQFRAKMWE